MVIPTSNKTMNMLLLLLMGTLANAQVAQPEVETKYGSVLGSNLPLHTGTTVNSFLGIPFAAPPVEDLRWQPPQEPADWSEPLNATKLGTVCMQTVASMVQTTHPGWTDFGEDCLNLNIYTPGDMSGGPYPVMMWIHGGSYQQGANIMYPGYFLAGLHDVVVVVPNYRLGIFGFGTLENELMPGNYGLLDLVRVLEFIQENIAGFGGDPEQVTVFGESAGARAIGMLLMSPMATGLFHGAILQSGNEVAYRAIHHEGENAGDYMRQVGEDVDCPTDDDEELLECMRGVGARRLEAQSFNCTEGYHCNAYIAIVDGPGGFLPDKPMNLRAAGDYNKVPIIAGVCSEDGFFFLPGLLPITTVRGLEREEFNDWVEESTDWLSPGVGAEDREEDITNAIRFHYTYWPDIEDMDWNREMAGRIYTDYTYGTPANIQLKSHSQDADSYFYVFNYRSNNSLTPEWMGTTHGTEIQYNLGDPFYQFNDEILADSEIGILGTYDEDDMQFSEFMMELWANFAKDSNPTPEAIEPPNSDPMTWPRFINGEEHYLWMSRESYVGQHYKAADNAFWEKYMAWLLRMQTVP